MKCFSDGRTCTCDLDDISKGDCPRDPFRDMPDNDEDYEALAYLNGLHYDPIEVHS
jgi:hypothetical protein